MNELENISKTDFIDWISEFTMGTEKSAVSILGWEDGDYFVDLCKDDGGISESDIKLFKGKYLGKKFNTKTELIKEITRFQKKPFLISKKGKYRYDWDLHIWIGNKLIIYNVDIQRVDYHNLNFIEKLFGVGKTPSWIKKTNAQQNL